MTVAGSSRYRAAIDFLIRNRAHLLPTAILIMWALPPWYSSKPAWNAAPAVILAGFGLYQLNRVFDLTEDRINDPVAYARTWVNHRILHRIAVAALLASILVSLVLTTYLASAMLSVMVLLGILYSVPFLRRSHGSWPRLKHVPGIKNIIPSMVWPAATLLVPAMSGTGARWPRLWLAFIMLSCCVFAIEVAWDVRDSTGDKIAGITTLPSILGDRRALLVPLTGSAVQAAGVLLLVRLDIVPAAWLLPAFFMILLPAIGYFWSESLATNRDRSHLLVLMNTSALIPLGLVGRWVT